MLFRLKDHISSSCENNNAEGGRMKYVFIQEHFKYFFKDLMNGFSSQIVKGNFGLCFLIRYLF